VVRTTRTGRRLASIAAASAIGALVLSACSASGGRQSATPSVGTAGNRTVPQNILDLSFVDDNGAATTLASMRGKTVVLTDFLTLCQEICPLTSANLRSVQQAVGRAGLSADIVLVEVTVDPVRDTPARLAAYRKIVGADANWKFLTGNAANVAALWKWFGVAYEQTPGTSPAPIDWWTGKPLTYDIGHSDAVFFIDPKGTQRYVVSGPPNLAGEALPNPLASFLNEEGRANMSSPEADSWTATDVDAVLSWLTGRRIVGG
jgi:cytochrome oxidase Cu insertion factor (SCO1/SenC/PrrC family)